MYYNCPEWTYTDGAPDCDGIAKYGGYSVTYQGATHYEEITSAANNPAGGGGRGQRHYIGYGSGDGSFIMTGGMKISFPSTQTRLWIRWYQRWEPGFTTNWHTFKNLFFRSSSAARQAVFHTHGDGRVDLNPPDYGTTQSGAAYGYAFYPGGVSDGTWQCFEVFIDIPNSTFRVWVNGDMVAESTNVDFSGVSPFQDFLLPSNSRYLDTQVRYVDFDDIAITNTTPANTDSHGNPYIGPLNSSTGGGNTSNDEVSTPEGFSIMAN